MNEKWSGLAEDVKRYQENSFYPTDLKGIMTLSTNSRAALVKRIVEDEITKLFSKVQVSTTQKALAHLASVKSLKGLDLSLDYLTEILTDMTQSVGERLFIRFVESENDNVGRNVVFKFFSEKEHWRKNELNKEILKFLTDNNAIAAEADVKRALQMLTVPYGSNMLQLV